MTSAQFIHKPDVRLLAHSGGDESVLAAMLVSTQSEMSLLELEANAESGAGRINFLMKNRHGTPFEHNQFRFFIRAGIFVFREFHRHRIGWSYNEESGRYKQLAPIFYVPDEARPLAQTGKPGAYTMTMDEELYLSTYETLINQYVGAYAAYESMLNRGVAKEVARMCLPVGLTSTMYATCNARSLMAFLSLRTTDEDATFTSYPQYEIEQVARQMENIFATKMPITYKTWNDNGRVAP
jgi:thymidylate synthase (FAD)